MKRNSTIKNLFMVVALTFVISPAFAAGAAGVGELRHLTEILKDGQAGYQMASSDVIDLKLKTLFQGYGEQRAKFLTELREEVARLGGDPDEGGSVKGALHRGWINARTAVTKNDDKVVVDEVLRGEEAALKGYQETLAKDLPKSARKLVEDQRKAIQGAYDSVKQIDLKQEK